MTAPPNLRAGDVVTATYADGWEALGMVVGRDELRVAWFDGTDQPLTEVVAVAALRQMLVVDLGTVGVVRL